MEREIGKKVTEKRPCPKFTSSPEAKATSPPLGRYKASKLSFLLAPPISSTSPPQTTVALEDKMTGLLQTSTNQSKDIDQAQTEKWIRPGSLFYDPRLPNSINLPLPQRSIPLPSNQVQDRVYHPQTGKVTLEPHVTNAQPGELGKEDKSSAPRFDIQGTGAILQT
ncbi:hypothetical protein DL95DRAFT_456772 [Leptodontidium sp. 2 PMI_412]|nr:hypothetical protein DL95DRAFT_456772 [Leptodontidium sp. 2 PMI_412]